MCIRRLLLTGHCRQRPLLVDGHRAWLRWSWPRLVILGLLVNLTACVSVATDAPSSAKPVSPSVAISPPPANTPAITQPRSDTQQTTQGIVPPAAPFAQLSPANWSEMPGIADEAWLDSWPAWLQSCVALKNKPEWRAVCASATQLTQPTAEAVFKYWQQYFNVYLATHADGTTQGLMTGYYQPILKGSKTASATYKVPLYQVPADLITVGLDALFPELKYKRLRGRLQGQRLVPYFSRAEIEQTPSPLQGQELVWVEDPVEAFFLQVQGSGIIALAEGGEMQVGYADQNGHPYQSIGRLLVARGEMTASEASMQAIKAWAQTHPTQLRSLLDANPSYVFFKVLPPGLSGPLGALGVPLTAGRSVAVDPQFIPLGAPFYISTTLPNQSQPLQRLMMAQDTGGAIKGGVRADVFWGAGEAAGKLAGAMRQSGQVWVWLPKTFRLPQSVGRKGE